MRLLEDVVFKVHQPVLKFVKSKKADQIVIGFIVVGPQGLEPQTL